MPHCWKSHALAHIIFLLLAQAETVITADQGVRGGKPIELKKMVDEAVASCPCVKRVFVYSRTGADVPMGPKDIYLDKVAQTFSMLYTPGLLKKCMFISLYIFPFLTLNFMNHLLINKKKIESP